MKPTKNQFYCCDCGKLKMLFESQKKADNFIKFNKDAMEEEGRKVPVRSYYCEACGGWHVTSNPDEEQFKRASTEHRPLTRLGRMVEMKMQKRNHESFLIKKGKLHAEAKQLFAERDYVGCIQKCREGLKLLKDNGKDWWRDNLKIKRMMCKVICCEANEIEGFLKKKDFKSVNDIISHCGCVFKELEGTEGLEEYRTVLCKYLDQCIEKLRMMKSKDSLNARLQSVSRKINEMWIYLTQNKYSQVEIEIDKYTAELVALSNAGIEKDCIRPVINKLYDLREAYRKRMALAA